MTLGESDAEGRGLRAWRSERWSDGRGLVRQRRSEVTVWKVSGFSRSRWRAEARVLCRGGSSVSEGCDLRFVDNLPLWRKEWERGRSGVHISVALWPVEVVDF